MLCADPGQVVCFMVLPMNAPCSRSRSLTERKASNHAWIVGLLRAFVLECLHLSMHD